MIRLISWNDGGWDKSNPFSVGKNARDLRITFHSDSLANLSEEEQKIIEILRDLSHFPEIESLDTQSGWNNYISVKLDDSDPFSMSVVVRNKDNEGLRWTGFSHPNQYKQLASEITQEDESHPITKTLTEELFIAEAHHTLKHDLFITASKRLLDNREYHWLISRTNLVTPSEALKIVGLFLRSRGYFDVGIAGMTIQMSHEQYYSIARDNRLPNLQEYYQVCYQLCQKRKQQYPDDDTDDIAQTIMERSSRVLEALDYIARLFYCPENLNSASGLLYHFEYLNLLLSGIFDGLALIGYRIHQTVIQNTISDNRINFSRDKNGKPGLFIQALNSSNDPTATKLFTVISDKQFISVIDALHALRNTIHDAGMRRYASCSFNSGQKALVFQIPSKRHQKILSAVKNHSSLNEWGIIENTYNSKNNSIQSHVDVEPYTCSNMLVKESFKMIDEICKVCISNISILHLISPLPNVESIERKVWREKVEKRVVLMSLE